MTWRVARSLDVLLGEINALAPNRSKASDGSIGDAAHASRDSDHNPWRPDPEGEVDGVVGARDFTHDPANGLDAHSLAENVRLLALDGHPALTSGAYVISRGRIASATYGWAWRTYTGSNPHDHHSHVSVATDANGYDSTAPWFKENDNMTPADFDRIRQIVREESVAAVDKALDAELNINDPKGDPRFRDWSVRRAIKALLTKTGAVT